MTKKCNRCLIEKSLTRYFVNPSANNPGRLKSICKECCRDTARKYMTENREKYREIHRTNRRRNLEHYRKKGIRYAQERRKTNPWEQSYYMAQNRCTSEHRPSWKHYGGKGIKFLLTMDDVRMLWFRDCAESLKWPSLDRIDPNSDYSLGNCRFIEFSENSRRAATKLKERNNETPKT